MPDDFLPRLVLLLIGIAFSAVFVPLVSRHWQNRDRQLKVRTELVAEMSECIMALDVELKANARAQYERAKQATHGGIEEKAAKPKEIEEEAKLGKSVRSFDVKRCAIGTKLEVYFPAAEGLTIARGWASLAHLFIEFAHWHTHTDSKRAELHKRIDALRPDPKQGRRLPAWPRLIPAWRRLMRRLIPTGGGTQRRTGQPTTTVSTTPEAADSHKDADVDEDWSRCERRLLDEKHRLVSAVSMEWMPDLKTHSRRTSLYEGFIIEVDRESASDPGEALKVSP